MAQLQVIARYTIAPGNEKQVRALLGELTAASREEPGNVSFVAYEQIDEPRELVLLERYSSSEAFTAHRESAHFLEIARAQIIPLLASRVVEQYEVPEP